jgi:hypothetical protein
MTLPRKIPKAAKRSSRWRSIAHCNFVRSHHCCSPLCGGFPIEVAHIRLGSGSGIGQKPDDWNTISLCRDCHAEQHRVGEATFAKRFKVDLSGMAEQFAAASPKAAEIRRIKQERANG